LALEPLLPHLFFLNDGTYWKGSDEKFANISEWLASLWEGRIGGSRRQHCMGPNVVGLWIIFEI
jgi:hypothetical protein